MSPDRGVPPSEPTLGTVRWALLFLLAGLTFAVANQPGAAFNPWWVQNHRETQLWSGPDSRAISFGTLPQWSYLLVVAPQQGPRLYVMNPVTRGYAFVDASAVGPSSARPPAPAAAGSAPAASQPVAGPSPSTPQPAVPTLAPADPPPAPTESAAGSPPSVAEASTAPPPAPTDASPAPSAPTIPVRAAPRMASGFQAWWASNFLETQLWAGRQADAASLGKVPQFRRFLVLEAQNGDRLHVWSPETDGSGYLDAYVLGPSGPSVWMQPHPVQFVRHIGLPGRAIGDKSYVRVMPFLDDETELRHAPNNTPLDIQDALVAPDGIQWYTVGDGGYIRAQEVRLPRPANSTLAGRWIDADLSEPTMVTAYEGDRIVYSMLAIKGTVAFSTPTGTFDIVRRVENETMDSSTLTTPIPRNAPGGYYLKNVLYTQYFTWEGASFHYNYWLGTFGYAGSHGCLGLNQADSRWLWDWAAIGTKVVVR